MPPVIAQNIAELLNDKCQGNNDKLTLSFWENLRGLDYDAFYNKVYQHGGFSDSGHTKNDVVEKLRSHGCLLDDIGRQTLASLKIINKWLNDSQANVTDKASLARFISVDLFKCRPGFSVRLSNAIHTYITDERSLFYLVRRKVDAVAWQVYLKTVHSVIECYHPHHLNDIRQLVQAKYGGTPSARDSFTAEYPELDKQTDEIFRQSFTAETVIMHVLDNVTDFPLKYQGFQSHGYATEVVDAWRANIKDYLGIESPDENLFIKSADQSKVHDIDTASLCQLIKERLDKKGVFQVQPAISNRTDAILDLLATQQQPSDALVQALTYWFLDCSDEKMLRAWGPTVIRMLNSQQLVILAPFVHCYLQLLFADIDRDNRTSGTRSNEIVRLVQAHPIMLLDINETDFSKLSADAQVALIVSLMCRLDKCVDGINDTGQKKRFLGRMIELTVWVADHSNFDEGRTKLFTTLDGMDDHGPLSFKTAIAFFPDKLEALLPHQKKIIYTSILNMTPDDQQTVGTNYHLLLQQLFCIIAPSVLQPYQRLQLHKTFEEKDDYRQLAIQNDRLQCNQSVIDELLSDTGTTQPHSFIDCFHDFFKKTAQHLTLTHRKQVLQQLLSTCLAIFPSDIYRPIDINLIKQGNETLFDYVYRLLPKNSILNNAQRLLLISTAKYCDISFDKRLGLHRDSYPELRFWSSEEEKTARAERLLFYRQYPEALHDFYHCLLMSGVPLVADDIPSAKPIHLKTADITAIAKQLNLESQVKKNIDTRIDAMVIGHFKKHTGDIDKRSSSPFSELEACDSACDHRILPVIWSKGSGQHQDSELHQLQESYCRWLTRSLAMEQNYQTVMTRLEEIQQRFGCQRSDFVNKFGAVVNALVDVSLACRLQLHQCLANFQQAPYLPCAAFFSSRGDRCYYHQEEFLLLQLEQAVVQFQEVAKHKASNAQQSSLKSYFEEINRTITKYRDVSEGDKRNKYAEIVDAFQAIPADCHQLIHQAGSGSMSWIYQLLRYLWETISQQKVSLITTVGLFTPADYQLRELDYRLGAEDLDPLLPVVCR